MNHIIKGFVGDPSQLMFRCQIILPKLNNLLNRSLNAISLSTILPFFPKSFMNAMQLLRTTVVKAPAIMLH